MSFGMPFRLEGETPAEYQARFEGYRRQDQQGLSRDLPFLAAAGRRESHFGNVPIYSSDRSEEAIRQAVRRMYSASWAR